MIYNQIARVQGYEEITRENILSLRGQGPRAIMRALKVPPYKLPFIVARVRTELATKIASLKPIPGIAEVMPSLKAKGYTLGILSSNSQENIRNFLVKNNMNIFDFIHSGSSIFGKARLLRQIMRERKLVAETTWYIGDEVRDIEAAKKVGTKAIATTWGANTKEALVKLSSNLVAEKPSDLLKL